MNPNDAAEAIRLGKTFQEVADACGVSRQRVWQVVNRWSVANGEKLAIGKRLVKRFRCPNCKRSFALSNQQIQKRMGKRRENRSKLPVKVQFCSSDCAAEATRKRRNAKSK